MDLQSKDFISQVEQLQAKTAYDEDTIGCFLCNYGDNFVCAAFQSSGCKSALKCGRLARLVGRFNMNLRSTS